MISSIIVPKVIFIIESKNTEITVEGITVFIPILQDVHMFANTGKLVKYEQYSIFYTNLKVLGGSFDHPFRSVN